MAADFRGSFAREVAEQTGGLPKQNHPLDRRRRRLQ
jgi:hypothetical protein